MHAPIAQMHVLVCHTQGRTFDGHLLDMIEMGVADYKSLAEFPGNAKRVGSKPAMVFEGDAWENEEKYSKLRNMLIGELH